MAKRNDRPRSAKSGEKTDASAISSTNGAIDDRLVAFADMLGTTIGTIEGKAKGLVDSRKLSSQLASVRDSASHLLDQIATMAAKPRKKTPAPAPRASKGRSGGLVDAPGKKHRKPMPADPRAKSARSQTAKVQAARTPVMAARRRGRG